MFKAIWKGVKWFFTISDGNNKKIIRKHKFSTRPGMGIIEESVTGSNKPKCNDKEISQVYAQLVETHKRMGGNSPDVIESAKRELWSSHDITQKHKEHILALCGFQKTEYVRGERVYDQRLIQVINLAMNIYTSQMVSAVDDIVKTLSDKLDTK